MRSFRSGASEDSARGAYDRRCIPGPKTRSPRPLRRAGTRVQEVVTRLTDKRNYTGMYRARCSEHASQRQPQQHRRRLQHRRDAHKRVRAQQRDVVLSSRRSPSPHRVADLAHGGGNDNDDVMLISGDGAPAQPRAQPGSARVRATLARAHQERRERLTYRERVAQHGDGVVLAETHRFQKNVKRGFARAEAPVLIL